MYWLQTIREHLHLSQEELAGYLGLSLHTIKSVETGRRPLPMDTLHAALVIFNAIKDSALGTAAGNVSEKAEEHHLQHTRRHHRHCCRKLARHLARLDSMQRTHARACSCLDVYRRLAQSLTPAHKEDQARLQWVQRKIRDAQQGIEENNVAAQNVLAAKIAGLRTQVQALDECQQGLNRDVPEVNRTDNLNIITPHGPGPHQGV
jgi:transcriptional regulator with XRE-family HTH domain